jgi:hypothetical protein
MDYTYAEPSWRVCAPKRYLFKTAAIMRKPSLRISSESKRKSQCESINEVASLIQDFEMEHPSDIKSITKSGILLKPEELSTK